MVNRELVKGLPLREHMRGRVHVRADVEKASTFVSRKPSRSSVLPGVKLGFGVPGHTGMSFVMSLVRS